MHLGLIQGRIGKAAVLPKKKIKKTKKVMLAPPIFPTSLYGQSALGSIHYGNNGHKKIIKNLYTLLLKTKI
jgi:hypothetical protein